MIRKYLFHVLLGKLFTDNKISVNFISYLCTLEIDKNNERGELSVTWTIYALYCHNQLC